MSDPVTNVEIEDVLSSIRRLVTEEKRTTQQSPPSEPPAVRDRLVLTPSLRVTDPAPDEPDQERDQAYVPDGAGADGFVSEPESGPVAEISEPETAKIELGEAEPAVTEPAETGAVGETPAAERAPAPEEPSGANGAASENGEKTRFGGPEYGAFETVRRKQTGPDAAGYADMSSRDAVAEESEDRAVEGTVAEDPAAGDADSGATGAAMAEYAGGGDGEPEDDGSEANDAHAPLSDSGDSAPWADPEATLFEAARNASGAAGLELSFQEGSEPEPEPEPGTAARSGAESDSGRAAGSLGFKIAALEAAIAQTQDQWEPDGEGGDDYAGTRVETIAWQDHDPAGPAEPAADGSAPTPDPAGQTDAAGMAGPRPGSEDGDTAVDLFSADDAFLDEESLRELVADIVRQELQGALGERITRNVRKLVRREIHRALTAQELE